jgi:hypothetical protein
MSLTSTWPWAWLGSHTLTVRRIRYIRKHMRTCSGFLGEMDPRCMDPFARPSWVMESQIGNESPLLPSPRKKRRRGASGTRRSRRLDRFVVDVDNIDSNVIVDLATSGLPTFERRKAPPGKRPEPSSPMEFLVKVKRVERLPLEIADRMGLTGYSRLRVHEHNGIDYLYRHVYKVYKTKVRPRRAAKNLAYYRKCVGRRSSVLWGQPRKNKFRKGGQWVYPCNPHRVSASSCVEEVSCLLGEVQVARLLPGTYYFEEGRVVAPNDPSLRPAPRARAPPRGGPRGQRGGRRRP